MEETIIKRLYAYFKRNELGKATGMKFMYRFQEVEVNVYFDGYDEKIPVMILVLKHKDVYSFLPCNVRELSEETFAKYDIPEQMKAQLLNQQSFHLFLDRLAHEIAAEECIIRNYKADLRFKRLEQREYQRYGMYPFFGGIVKGVMEDGYLEKLHTRMTMSKDVLRRIQQSGHTVVTVERCKERKKLASELLKIV